VISSQITITKKNIERKNYLNFAFRFVNIRVIWRNRWKKYLFKFSTSTATDFAFGCTIICRTIFSFETFVISTLCFLQKEKSRRFYIIREKRSQLWIRTAFLVVGVVAETVWDIVKKESNRPCCVVVRAFANFFTPLRIRSSLEEKKKKIFRWWN